jgi:phage terminase large subunit GpA-like protein
MTYQFLGEMVVETAEMVRPPERLTVPEAAEKYREINNPGSYVGRWRNDMTPQMVEPSEILTSREYTGMVFVGPAQTGKTDPVLNWILHTAICDPADMMIVQTTQTAARDFSKRRLDRLYRHSPEVGDRLIPGAANKNVFDSRFKSGWLLTLSWPAISELSGKPIPHLWLTDYDRMPQDIDGEGSPFDLCRARTRTYRSYGMTAAESSPGFDVDNPKWLATTPHEAPPTQGILALYNRGDRRRWYWRCVKCRKAFEPSFSLLQYPECEDMMESAEQVNLSCPHCHQAYAHDADNQYKTPGKDEMNQEHARWIRDNQTWMENGTVMGNPIRSDIGSFWLKGPAATFVDWKAIVLRYLQALREFEKTGDENPLRTTTNTDQGEPYIPEAAAGGRLPEDLKNRAKEFDRFHVPHGVRFLIATVDVQKNAFVVQVQGIGEGFDIWIVDRFSIRKSERLDEDGEHYWVSPGSYLEDWKLIVSQVINKTYELGDGSGRRMQIKHTFCDSGGREGVTSKAYDFWRYLRDTRDEEMDNLYRRFHLVKGSPLKSLPRVALTFPDSERKDRRAAARGEVPVLQINSNQIKDQTNKMLDREAAGGGKVNFPEWLEDWFYTELTAEVRTTKGWENLKRSRNEAWDLLCYCVAGCLSQYIGIEHIQWDKPPSWAKDWDDNDLVSAGDVKRFAKKAVPQYSLESLAQELA